MLYNVVLYNGRSVVVGMDEAIGVSIQGVMPICQCVLRVRQGVPLVIDYWKTYFIHFYSTEIKIEGPKLTKCGWSYGKRICKNVQEIFVTDVLFMT